ncbi:MAG: hypothetical protein NTX03_04550 [Bacteroidetes bacterium]|nr:hypothetical protein [Bacteroidota bacterium]
MSQNYSNTHFWKTLPDRDETLEVIYNFLKELNRAEPDAAQKYVLVGNMAKFREVLHDSLYKLLKMAIEDEQWEQYEGKDLSLEIDNPFEVDEDLILPEFSGSTFVLTRDENISVKVILKGYITSIRLHFNFTEHDELFYLKLMRITAE